MKTVVIGGSGLIGSKLVNILSECGHEVVAASPDTGVNTITREGLSQALGGASVVIDVANSPSYDEKAVMDFFEISGRNLLTEESVAGIKHHIVLSIVGTDRLSDSAYYRAKLSQETLVRNSDVPYTIVRSTQFFEFLGGIAKSATDAENVFLSPAYVQPIAANEVASALARVADSSPINGIVEIAGPEKFRLSEIVQQYLLANADPRQVTADIHARYFGAELNDHSLTPGNDATLGQMSFADWLAERSNVIRLSAGSK